MRMNNLQLFAVGLAVALVVCYATYRMKGSRKARLDIPSETYDDVLSLGQITSFFKSLGLKKIIHTPFVAEADAPAIKNKFTADTVPAMKAGYVCLIAGVYEEGQDIIRLGKIFYVKSLDEELKGMLGDDGLVVLS